MSKRSEQKSITAENYDNITGYITFGPKDNSLCSVAICYVPTEEQIKNSKEAKELSAISKLSAMSKMFGTNKPES